MSKLTREERLKAIAPEMYKLLDKIAFFITEIDKLYSSVQIPFFSVFLFFLKKIKILLAQIDGTEEENE